MDLAIALTNSDLGQEIHIIFIMVLLTITIFFCHSLIRLCMLMLNPPPEPHTNPAFPSINPSEGFQPIVPIRVHLRRDEEAAEAGAGVENDLADMADPEKDMPPPPPPAYGLWRSSVRVNPDLLHWQRVEAAGGGGSMRGSAMSSNIGGGGGGGSRNGSVTGPTTSRSSPLAAAGGSTRGSAAAPDDAEDDEQVEVGPRPPSYASEDGVSYILEAEPRSTAPGEAYSEIHPAWRPGFAMSEVRAGELPETVTNPSRRS
ncbi:ER degradation-enhancing alpha-mannosidase 1 [Pyrenophora seminiperda CCB06]|uniref:ER degradation-enhancing alpha-mannosidase 1 n=1 Tax=Pyrenophora seminiperda CCB06 TaxID=1302712 RepID=A0A3M7LYR9_9PLEO|nr:ER degradation-enhancing alpha-mannosidase 1 [Pyrenophora seminiperda CCB06]